MAASTVYGHAAASYGVSSSSPGPRHPPRLPRPRRYPGPAHGTGARRHSGGRVDLGRILPLFIVAFLGAVVVNTVGLVPHGWHHPMSDVSTWMITAAMAAIGLSTNVGRIRRAGLRPMALGAVLWLTVGLASLGLQGLTGLL